MKNIVAANWKMNASRSMLEEYFTNFNSHLGALGEFQHKAEVVFALPSLYLSAAQSYVSALPITLAAQNIHWEASGAFTGEQSIDMLRDWDISSTLIGHSERRQYFNETDETVAKKVKACDANGLRYIACIGETLEERESGKMQEVINRQLKAIIDQVSKVDLLTIAYEPVWAIGTGKTATSEQAQEVHAYIRGMLKERFADKANEIAILYGGSVKSANFAELLAQPDINGGLVGGASLKPDEFFKLLEIAI